MDMPSATSYSGARFHIGHFEPVTARVCVVKMHHGRFALRNLLLAGFRAVIFRGKKERKKGN